ncbi:putative Ig domain-containing protein [Mariniflexile ostreae]|uniref:Ig domain-containing protein n=1 Tax=Mariniflexile ostreae TaxID=1520892 RepID=A0ABV5FF82_9FLAO
MKKTQSLPIKEIYLSFMAILLLFAFNACESDDEIIKAISPEGLRYSQMAGAFQGEAFQSSAPVVSSSTKPVFEIMDGLYDSSYNALVLETFEINDSTGVISLQADNDLLAGKYGLDIKVSNDTGETLFKNVFQLDIEAYELSKLIFSPSEFTATVGKSFASTVPSISGSRPVSFKLVDAPEGFNIDNETGVISLEVGNPVPAGVYSLSVEATNVTGTVSFKDIVTIELGAPSVQILFDDGWDAEVIGSTIMGNFKSVSVIGSVAWQIGNVADKHGDETPGAFFKTDKKENSSWLVSNQIDLVGAENCELDISAYTRYAMEGRYEFNVYVTTNANAVAGDQSWVALNIVDIFEIGKDHIAKDQIVDISVYDNQTIKLALEHKSFALPTDPEGFDIKGTTHVNRAVITGLK